jgi:hypothetical protein
MIIEWKPVKCLECDEVEFIPKAWNQNWFMCWDCGLFREVEKQNAK